MFGLLNESNESLDQKSYATDRGRFYLIWNRTKQSGRPNLVALMAGSAAYSVEETDNDSLVREITDRLTKIFSQVEVPQPSEVIVTRWKRDPFARGSYSFIGPETLAEDYDVMARPVGSIHFAGEATSRNYPATVHGAYLSGLRAASDVMDSLLGGIKVTSPLISRGLIKVKNEPATDDAPIAFSSIKRQKGYVDVWEPIPAPVDPGAEASLQDEVEIYEARIIGAIIEQLGDRPLRPSKPAANPYLLYQNDEWYNVKARLEIDTGAKASRNEVRIALGAEWRNLVEEKKKPYVDRSQTQRDTTAAAVAAFSEQSKVWDREAARIRREFMLNDPPALRVREKLEGRTAIEFGGGRKGRKTGGYNEEDAKDEEGEH